MKQILYILLYVSIAVLALIEQSKPVPNKFIMLELIAFFMIGLFPLMKKISFKNEK